MNELKNKNEKLALFGGEKFIQDNLPEYLHLTQAELDKAVKSLQTTPLTSLYGGYDIDELECQFKSKFNFNNAIAVNSGTSSLHAAIVALDIGPGDEIIVPTYSFVASVSVIVQQGATPVFCDINETDLGLDVEKCAQLITLKFIDGKFL